MQIRKSNLPLFTCDCSDYPPLMGPLNPSYLGRTTFLIFQNVAVPGYSHFEPSLNLNFTLRFVMLISYLSVVTYILEMLS